MKLWLRMAVLGVAAFACLASAGTTYPRPSKHDVATLRSRAAFDLGCPAEQLQFFKIDDRTAGVSGCNRQATYILMCDRNDYDRRDESTGCTWLVNASAESAPAPAPAPALAPAPAPEPPPPAPGAGTP